MNHSHAFLPTYDPHAATTANGVKITAIKAMQL